MPADDHADTDDLAAIWDELTPEERREERQGMRRFCDRLRLFKVCGRTACRKAHACRGDPFTCADAYEREYNREMDAALKELEAAPLEERMRVADRILGPVQAPVQAPATPRARRA